LWLAAKATMVKETTIHITPPDEKYKGNTINQYGVDLKAKGYLTVGEQLVLEDGGKGGLREPTGKWHGDGDFPEDTMQYFEFIFMGEKRGFKDYGYASCYHIKPLLLDHIANNEPSLKILNCSGRLLRDREMMPLVEALKTNTTITVMDFSRNEADQAYINMMEVLKENNTVKTLNLKNNDMHDKAVCAVAEMLSCNSSITYLDLTCNFVRTDAKYIAEALEMNTTLETLILDNCQIDDAEAEVLLEAIAKHPKIKTFHAHNNTCLSREVRKKMRGFKK